MSAELDPNNHHSVDPAGAWLDADQYAYVDTLAPAQLAWELLRRNQQYQQDWCWFIQTWQTLESRYGTPPNRDFFHWKKDPLAHRSAQPEWCIDPAQGPLLIECWMGEKWGYYKFPLNPQHNALALDEPPTWRPVIPSIPCITAENEYCGAQSNKLALGFDLNLPIPAQIAQAQQLLTLRQQRKRSRQEIVPTRLKEFRRYSVLYLRLLDALCENTSIATITQQLAISEQPSCSQLIAQAQYFAQIGYRNVLIMQ